MSIKRSEPDFTDREIIAAKRRRRVATKSQLGLSVAAETDGQQQGGRDGTRSAQEIASDVSPSMTLASLFNS